VAAFVKMGKGDFFWLDLYNSTYRNLFFRNLGFFGRVYFDMNEILAVAEMFAVIVDQTSKFTVSHSRNVAATIAFLGENIGYCSEEVGALTVAGLLHDLGKLSVPNRILEKPGKLSEAEYSIVKRHPYYTYRILEQIEGFGLVASWAGTHHENIAGTGYPFGIGKKELRLASRLISAADVFCALQEERPYRPAFGAEQAVMILEEMAREEKLDPVIVKMVLNLYDGAVLAMNSKTGLR
jgi:HD-GYP domain-containing protein (c-di-GMP phosphodiesterase class II)